MYDHLCVGVYTVVYMCNCLMCMQDSVCVCMYEASGGTTAFWLLLGRGLN